jgi:hypothetical protein
MWGGAVNTRMVIHVPVYELPRITIPRTLVNKGKKRKGLMPASFASLGFRFGRGG